MGGNGGTKVAFDADECRIASSLVARVYFQIECLLQAEAYVLK
jgi:hypothetical protein